MMTLAVILVSHRVRHVLNHHIPHALMPTMASAITTTNTLITITTIIPAPILPFNPFTTTNTQQRIKIRLENRQYSKIQKPAGSKLTER